MRGYAAHNNLEAASLSCLTLQETRESLGLSLAGAVVVVDEAHNLVEAVSSAHSAALQLAQVQQAHAQLTGYLERFRTRLAPGGLLPRQEACLMTHQADRTQQRWLKIEAGSQSAPPLAACSALGQALAVLDCFMGACQPATSKALSSRRRWHCTHVNSLSQSVVQALCLQGTQSTCRISWRSQHCSSQPCSKVAARQQR